MSGLWGTGLGHAELVRNYLDGRAVLDRELAARPARPNAPAEPAEPCGLGYKGVTVSPPEALTNPTSKILDELCTPERERRSRRFARMAARARAQGARAEHPAVKSEAERRERWYQSRADALRRPYTLRAADCEVPGVAPWVELMCEAEGTVRMVPARCGLGRWCASCVKRKRGAWFKRVARGLGDRHREELGRWNREGRQRGRRPDVTLVTLTVRHTGDLRADRARINRGWRRLRAWLHERDGRALPYVLAWELTEGADELGHVHAHVAAVWPWRDLRALDAEWRRATEGEGVNVDVQGKRRASKGAKAASSYLAAYIGKGGCDSRDLRMRAAWHDLHASGARSWSSSVGALAKREPVPTCPVCKGCETVLAVHRPERYQCAPVAPTGPPAPQ